MKTLCPRCKREIRVIANSTYGGDVTFYHRCLPYLESLRSNGVSWWACVRPDGNIVHTEDVQQRLEYVREYVQEGKHVFPRNPV